MLILKITESVATLLTSLGSTVISVSTEYGVDPFIFSLLYIGLAPLVWLSAGMAVNNFKKQKPIGLLLAVFAVSFISPYAYIFYAGKNISVWIYLLISVIAGAGIYNLLRKVRPKNAAAE
jgi:hypothetical protein